ncbi:MAG: NYN domain-containing protein, partial [Paracoccaceae bacterium]
VIDGSNVMHWRDKTPQLAPLLAVVAELTRRGLTPGVVFDANAGYKLSDRYHHDGAFGKMLGLPRDRVFVVPKGTPADGYVLTAARELNARVVSNDRFRDWQEDFPEVTQPGHVIRGGYRDGVLWLDPE